MVRPDITVVIPVYNAAPYLQECLDSVFNQSLKQLEIICVNDASTDTSENILSLQSALDRRLRTINLVQNQGAGAARNIGIDESNGDYVAFLDADDTLPINALAKMHCVARESKSDLVVGKYILLRTSKTVQQTDKSGNNSYINTTMCSSSYLQSIPGGHWCNLYRSDMLNKHQIRYDVDLTFGEDQVFQASAMINAQQISLIDDVVYHYHHYRTDSITRRAPSLKNLLDDIEYRRRITDLLISSGLEKAGRNYLMDWSFSIREYWHQFPDVLEHRDCTNFFTAFRKVVSDYCVTPWNEKTPERHKHLLQLVLAKQDDEAIQFLSGVEANQAPRKV